MDLLQSHCHFRSPLKSTVHRLISFLAIILHLPIPKTQLYSVPLLPTSYPGRLASRNSTFHFRLLLRPKVKVTLRLTASQSVSLYVEPHLDLMDRYLLQLDSYILFLWAALFDERTGLSFVYAVDPCQRSLSQVRVPWDSRPYLMSQIWDFSFRHLLRLAGSRWLAWDPRYIASSRTEKKTPFPSL
jgi:hypothetical protein